MAAKTYKLTLSSGDECTITIPDTAGTYNLKLNLSNGDAIDAGNIVVDGTARTYRLTLGLPDGSSIDAGTLTTPVAGGNELLPPIIVDDHREDNRTIELFITNNNAFEVECYIEVYDEYGGVYGSAGLYIPANAEGYSTDVPLSSSVTSGTVEVYFCVDNDGDVTESEIVTYEF